MELSSSWLWLCLVIELFFLTMSIAEAEEGHGYGRVNQLNPSDLGDFRDSTKPISSPFKSYQISVQPFESNVNPFLSHISQAWRVRYLDKESAVSTSESREDLPFGDGEKDFGLMVEEIFRKKSRIKNF